MVKSMVVKCIGARQVSITVSCNVMGICECMCCVYVRVERGDYQLIAL